MTTSQESGGASRVSSLEIAAAAIAQYPRLQDDFDDLTYPRSSIRDFTREAFQNGAMWAQDRLAPVLDATRHKSENYELRATAAEATLAKVRAWAESALATQAWESFDDGRQFSARAALYIIDGKTP